MGFRYGFKAECNRYSLELREELNLLPEDPLCPFRLSNHLAIPVIPLAELRSQLPEEVDFLKGDGKKEFSAVTVFSGPSRMIVHNDSHHPNRQNANIAHELAHALLGHPPCEPLNEAGGRNYHKEIEDEANWLGPALLVSDPAAWRIAKSGMQMKAASREYGVSAQLISMRIGVLGIRTRLARSKAKYGNT